MDRAATGKTLFVTLTYGSRTVSRTDSLHQTVNGLVGNVDWENPLLLQPANFQASTVLALEGGPPVKAGRGFDFPILSY